MAGTAIAAVKEAEAETDAAAGITEAEAAQAADKLAKLTAAAQALGVDTAGMDAPALQTAITEAMAA